MFFFDINDGEELPDSEGLDLRDIKDAKLHALKIATSYIEAKPSCDIKQLTISIRDAQDTKIWEMTIVSHICE